MAVTLRRSATTTITKQAIITAVTMRAVCSQLEPENTPVSMFGCVGVAVGVSGGRYGLKVGFAVGFGVQKGSCVGDAGVGFPIVSVCVLLQPLCPTTIV